MSKKSYLKALIELAFNGSHRAINILAKYGISIVHLQ
jgi:hypothetical protein